MRRVFMIWYVLMFSVSCMPFLSLLGGTVAVAGRFPLSQKGAGGPKAGRLAVVRMQIIFCKYNGFSGKVPFVFMDFCGQT